MENEEAKLTEKQIDLAMKRKEMFIRNSQEFTEYLKKQDDPNWFLKRPYFVFCAKSFSKLKRDEYQAKEALKKVAEKSTFQNQSQANSSGVKI